MTLVLVAGATGYVGRVLVPMLRERDVPAVAHVRPTSARLAEWTERFGAAGASVDVTPWEQEAMTATMARRAPTHVFALLGTTKDRARAEDLASPYQAIDYGLTKMLLDACVAAGCCRSRFVYLSAAGASASSRSDYLRARYTTEEAIRASGLPYTIARPSFITGPDRDERRPGERLASGLTDSMLVVAALFGMRRLRERYRSTSNDALAAALIRLAFDDSAANRVLESEELR